MPDTNPFPLPESLSNKVNSPALLAWFQQFGTNGYLSAEEIIQIKTGLDYLYENMGSPGGGIPEAPVDGDIYGRKNSAWEIMPAQDNKPKPITVTLSDIGATDFADNVPTKLAAYIAAQDYDILDVEIPVFEVTENPLPENRFEFSTGNVMTIEDFETAIGFTLENPVVEGDTIKFTNSGYAIPANAFQNNADLIDVVCFAETVGNLSFQGCYSLLSFSAPLAISIGTSCFETSGGLTSINIPLCASLGSGPTDYSVFFDVSGNTITMTIPVALMTINGGGVHSAVDYLDTYNTLTLITV